MNIIKLKDGTELFAEMDFEKESIIVIGELMSSSQLLFSRMRFQAIINEEELKIIDEINDSLESVQKYVISYRDFIGELRNIVVKKKESKVLNKDFDFDEALDSMDELEIPDITALREMSRILIILLNCPIKIS